MVQAGKEKPSRRPPNRAQRPMIWQDGMAEVKETFRRVALVKHAGFSVWDDPRRGPTLEKILRWNRQARNLSQVPKSLREKIPVKVLKEIQNNRSVTGYVSQTHLQNVKGMCQRIHSQKSFNERRKNLYDPTMYPVFVRRPPTVACLIDTSELDTSPRNMHSHFRSRRRPYSSPAYDHMAPLSYTPQPFKLLYDISNGSYPVCSFAKRPRSGAAALPSSTSCYGRMFNRSASAMAKKSVLDIAEALERQRGSSAPTGNSHRQHRSRRPPSVSSPSSSASSTPKSITRGWLDFRRNNAQQQEQSSNRSNSNEGESRPPSRCANRPPSSRSSWRINLVERPTLEDLSNRSTYSDCVSLDSLGMPVLFSSRAADEATKPKVSVPKLRLRGGSSPRKSQVTSSALSIVEHAEQSKQIELCSGVATCSEDEELRVSFQQEQQERRPRPSTANVPPLVNQSSDGESSECNWRPQSASNAVGRRGSRVTFASPVESRWDSSNKSRLRSSIDSPGEELASGGEVEEEILLEEEKEEDDVVVVGNKEEEQEQQEEKEEERANSSNEDVIIKHSSDPYVDFKSSMMSMIESEGLEMEGSSSQELDELFQYYMDLNPRMHHPILARVIRDIKQELDDQRAQSSKLSPSSTSI
ncbi:uncharacterized protein LOC112341982 [Selaginella moellendorffii]|uniref:uncharacterized protein LOC112341982 n=1 Tax=Selaginella moellendorffii TaxID=88036 RepID=UPI000D1C5DB7|nr:uncharacterized protein LOC112341982 [Selaginella moellendorffii]|eukprot:XP_024518816.1 uncharacterized protein LOC112341982 [Selaginella moellendorffii]